MPNTNARCIYDTHVTKGSPGSNYENMDRINVFPSDSIPVLQFNLPNLEEINITSARLFFYISDRGRNKDIKVTLCDIRESLTGLNYNTYLSKVADSEVLSAEDKYTCPSPAASNFNRWISIDILNLIIGHLNQNFYTLVLKSSKISGSSGASSTTIKSSEGGFAPYIEINYDYAAPFKPTIQHPNGDTVPNTGNLQFLWAYNSSGTSPQKKFDLRWKMQAELRWNDVSQETSNTYYTMSASGFTNGIVEWGVRTYNKHNMVSEWSESQFVVIGKPGNPVITGVKNDAITEITWGANRAEESGSRIKLIKNSAVIYDSGVIPGGITDSHVPNIMLDNGNYSALLSISNMYGMWSDEVSHSFTISNPKPEAPELRVSNRGDYVRLNYSPEGMDEYFIYRAEGEGEYMPIARVSASEYDDFMVKSGVKYRYFVRRYNKAYADSKTRNMEVFYQGFCLSVVGNMDKRVNLLYHDSEHFLPIKRDISNNNGLILYCGRKKPVKESGIFTSNVLSIEAYISKKNEKIFEEIYRNNGVFCVRSNDFLMFCDIGAVSETMKLFNKGYLLGLTMEEVDYCQEVKYND